MILFLGSMYIGDELNYYKKNTKSGLAISSNTYEEYIVQSLTPFEDVYVINRTPCGYFPKHFKKIRVSRTTGENHVSVGYVNLPIIRDISQYISLRKEVERMINEGNVTTIIGYMPFPTRMRVVARTKIAHPNITTVFYVPDLLQHSYSKDKTANIMKIVRKWQAAAVDKMSKYIDLYVYISKQMHALLGQNNNYIVQETIFKPQPIKMLEDKYVELMSSGFIYLYCGKITNENGIDRLIKAFHALPYDDARLVMCGHGKLQAKEQEVVRNDRRIILLGEVSHDDIMGIQANATVLINPRYVNAENTAYSFPGKLCEYMSIGKPVISSHLPGIPEDYDEYLIYIEDDSEETLRLKLNEIYEMLPQEREKIGNACKEFLTNNKSIQVLGKKLYGKIAEVKVK